MPNKGIQHEKLYLKELHQLIVTGNLAKVKPMARDVADKDRLYWKFGSHSPVHSAAGFGQTEILKYLLDDLRFPVNSFIKMGDSQRISPLQWAIHHSKKETVKVLLERGADIRAKGFWYDISGDAVDFAVDKKCQAVIDIVMAEDKKRKELSARSGNPPQDARGALASGDAKSPPIGQVDSSGPREKSQDQPQRVSSKASVVETVSTNGSIEAVRMKQQMESQNNNNVEAKDTLCSSSSSTISSAASMEQESPSSSSSNSLMAQISQAIREKRRKKRGELRKAESADAKIAALEARLRRLRGPGGDYRSEEQMQDLERELDELDKKMGRVVAVLRETEGEAAAADMVRQEEGEILLVACGKCGQVPAGQVHDCPECEEMFCLTCLVGLARCPTCGRDFKDCPPRRHRWAERILRKKRSSNEYV